MEVNDYFGTIREFFKAKKFCDLKIVAVPSDLESSETSSNAPSVLCHSLVLISAIPEIRFCIPTNQENEEEHRTIFLHNSTNAEVESIILDIYNVLAANDSETSNSDNDYYIKCHQRWVEVFGFQQNKKARTIDESLTKETKSTISSMVKNVSNQSIEREHVQLKPQLVELRNDLTRDCSTSDKINYKEVSETGLLQKGNDQSLTKEKHSIKENSISNKENNSKLISYQIDSTNISITNTNSSNNAQLTDNHLKSVSNDTKPNNAPNETIENTEAISFAPAKIFKKEYKERTCLDCNKTFPFNTKGQKNIYQEHISSHFKCDCNIAFGDRKAFKLHIKSIHKGRNGKSIHKICEDGIARIKMKKDKPTFR